MHALKLEPQEPTPPDLGHRYRDAVALGRGAGGTIWRMRDRILRRDVAIKVLPPGDGAKEFHALRQLAHPGTVEVLDVGVTRDGQPWFAMELVTGTPLGGPAAPASSAEDWPVLMARLLEVVGFVHERGWVHGDIKSDNVLALPCDRAVRLLDFGLALGAGDANDLRGTLGFIAPEVLDGGGVSVASDLYAVGVLGWLSLAGAPPFPESSMEPGLGPGEGAETLPRPSSAAIPDGLQRWVERLLQRDPALRPDSAEAAIAALEAITQRSLRDPAAAVANLAPTPPVGRAQALRRLRELLRRGGRVVLSGPEGAGLSYLLGNIAAERRGAGAQVRHASLGEDPEAAWSALAALCSECDVELEPVPSLHRLDPVATRTALAVHRARTTSTLRAAMRESGALWVLDRPDPETLAGSLLLAAAAAEPGVPLLLGARTDAAEAVRSVFLPGESLPGVALEPWTVARVSEWLGLALGEVHDRDALASILREVGEGLPRTVVHFTRGLLERGALFRGESGWGWNPDSVWADLEEEPITLADLPDLAPSSHAPQSVLRRATAQAEAGELRAAARSIASAFDGPRPPRSDEPGFAELLRLDAQVCGLLGRQAEAAERWSRLRDADGLSAPEAAQSVLEEAVARREAGDPTAALSLLQALSSQPSDDELAYRATREQASCMQALGQYASARDLAQAWLDGRPAAPPERLGAMEIVLANCEWQTGHADSAEERCARLLAILPERLTRARASAMTTRGTALSRLGRIDEAASCFASGGELYEAAGSLLDAARVSNNLGILRYSESDWHGAITAFERFRSLVTRLGNEGEVASAANNLGVLYRDTGQLERAAAALEEALEIARRLGLARVEPMVLGNLAEVAAVAGRRDDAERMYADAIEIAHARGILDEQIECWRRLAQRRLDDGVVDDVGDALDRARALANETGAQSELLLLDGLAAVLAVRRGDLGTGLPSAEACIAALTGEGSAHEAARLELRLAEALTEGGHDERAGDLLDSAEPVLRTLKARPELMRLEPLRQHIVAANRTRLHRLNSHYGALQQLTLALSRETDLQALLDLILDQTLDLVGFERGYVLLINDLGEAELKAGRTDAPESPADAGPSSSVSQRVIRSRRPLVALDIDDDHSLGGQKSVTAAALRSVVCVPIMRADQVLGLLYVDSRQVLGGAADDTVALLTACADAASVAIENARLVEALRRKNDSLAILAHELRTPLNAMIGLASLSLNGDGDVPHQVGLIKEQGERMNRMIDQVLSVARMDAGKADWSRELVDPLELVVKARDTMAPIAHQAGVRLTADLADDAPETIGDVDRLLQVLVNLLGNALKFAPAGGLVRLQATCAPDGRLAVVVDDDGPGIPPERLRAIFEPYEQAGDRGMRQRGVGLGLAISRRIVAEHGGTLSADNRPEGGARFELLLPAAADSSLVRT